MIKLLNIMNIIQNGQVLTDWINKRHVDSIIIASDIIAGDSTKSLQARLLTPKGMNVAVKELYGAVILLQSIYQEEQCIAIITERIEDALFILKETSRIEQVFLRGTTGLKHDDLLLLLERCHNCVVEQLDGFEAISLREMLLSDVKPEE